MHWSGRDVVLAFIDIGSGIEAAIIEKIFDPFFTTKTAGDGMGMGMGMGLAISHGIIEKHHGSIEVQASSSVSSATPAADSALPPADRP